MPTFAYDTETTGLYPWHGAEMFAYSIADENLDTEIRRLDGPKLRQTKSQSRLKQFWADETAGAANKVMHNAKFDLLMTEKRFGRRLDAHKQTVHCTHKQSHILQNHHHGHSIDQLGWELARYPRSDGAMKRLAGMCGGFHKVPEHAMKKYQTADGERGMLLHLFFYPKIVANPEWHDIYKMEMELIWTTMRSEEQGVQVRKKRTKELILELEENVDTLREDFFALAGRRFNPNSDDEIRKILFQKLGLPVLRRTPKRRDPKVDKFVLMELREKHPHPALDIILKIRSYTKGISMLESYLELSDDDGIVRSTINTCGPITGRESSSHPNLQNVQKSKVLLNPFPVPARECFGPKPGYVNLHKDYKGIEARLIIHYTKDPLFLDCLNNGDGDIHSIAAAIFYGERFNRATGKERKMLRDAAKNANFACPYGAGALQTAKTLGLRGNEGIQAYRRYMAAVPKYANFNRMIIREVKEKGYVTTAFGRRLHVPQNMAYMGANYLIQGTAAGILKRAQNREHAYNESATGGEVHLLLPIHDEIVTEYLRKRLVDLPEYLRGVRELMIDFPMFDIPLEIEIETSTVCWEVKKEYKIPA